MLPLPKLDDQSFATIYDDARKMIPRLNSEWTDVNFHDPGMTLIELFSLLKDMQQYYADQIGETHRLKYLELLGVAPREICPAATDLFCTVPRELALPRGYPFRTEGVVFEAARSCRLCPELISQIWSEMPEGWVRHAAFGYDNEISNYVFGKDPQKDSALYLGLTQAPAPAREAALHMRIFNRYPVARNPIADPAGFIPLAEVVWEYQAGAESWLPLEVVADQTCCFAQDGYLSFRGPRVMFQGPSAGMPGSGDLFWIRCRLLNSQFDVAPRFLSMSLNTLPAFQRQTLSKVVSFTDPAAPELKLDEYLALAGELEVQVLAGRNEDGGGRWRTLSADSYRVEHDYEQAKCRVILPETYSQVRVVCYQGEWGDRRIIGAGDGLPRQVVHLPFAGLIPAAFQLQVRREGLWEDWQLVRHFDSSTPYDRHFLFDPLEERLVFGDNERGILPAAVDLAEEEPNIKIIGLQLCQGETGNVKSDLEQRLEADLPEIQAYYIRNAAGGRNAQNIEEALRVFRLDLKKSYRMITEEDYGNLAMATPGLRIRKVKAIPEFRPGLADYPQRTAPNCITLAVEPFSESEQPVLQIKYNWNILRHLEPYRTVTTEVLVVTPEYFGLDIRVEIVGKPYYNDVRDRVEETIRAYIQEGGAEDWGWEFGKTVQYGELFGRIDTLEGVNFVRALFIQCESERVRRDPNGDLYLPPNGLVYVRSLDLQITT